MDGSTKVPAKRQSSTVIIPVVLSGGCGSRLWPLSRASYPKQFLTLNGEHSLLQQTLLRLKGLETTLPIIVTHEDYRFLVAEQLRQIDVEPSAIILEPARRNTASAITLAALQALKVCPEEQKSLLLILSSDHHIADTSAFQKSILTAVPDAESGRLITFGVAPTHPETGYGYLKATHAKNKAAVPVAAFVEKPDLKTAEGYLQSGDYLWNAGIFLFQTKKLLTELEQHAPSIPEHCQKALDNAVSDLDFIRVNKEYFMACPDISIDYSLLEKSSCVSVARLQSSWSDIGSWSALKQLRNDDEQGNSSHGDTLLVNSHNNYVHSTNRLIATIGIENLIIVDSDDALLVAHQNQSQNIGIIVTQLKEQNRSEASQHNTVYRPWGSYRSIDSDQRFQCKRITVNPGATLSLQSHQHRAEHWVVVTGTAEVTRGDETFNLYENESTFIPAGMKHRLANKGKIPLELIEVQSGSYLGEDDIIRYKDIYGRDVP